MGSDDDPPARPCRSEKHIGAIEERTAGTGFWMGGLLIGGLGQAGLHLKRLKRSIVLATRPPPKPTPHQISNASPSTHSPIPSHATPLQWEPLTREAATNH